MKRWIVKPARFDAGKFVVVDTRMPRGFIVADGVSRAVATRMVQELERTFA